MPNYLPAEQLSEITKKVDFYLRVHRYDAAEKLLKASLVTHGKVPKLLNLLGVTYHRQSRFPEALAFFARATKASPRYMEASLNLAATLCDLSRYDAAREVFSQLGELVTNASETPNLVTDRLAAHHAENGKLYEMSGMSSAALSEYDRALALNPRLVDIRLSIAKLCAKNNQIEKAKKELDDLLRDFPNLSEARNQLGLLFYRIGRRDDARREWEKALKLDPDSHVARAYVRLSSTWEQNQ